LPPSRRSLAPRPRRAAAVFAGGAAGTAARLAIGEAMASSSADFPWGTLTVNLAGAALLGFLLPRLLAGARSRQYTIPLLAIGGLGGFTTFSGFTVEVVLLVDAGRLATATIYGLLSLAAGLFLALVGRRLAARTL